MINVTNDEQNTLHRLANCIAAYSFKDPDAFCLHAKMISEAVPDRIKEIMYNFVKKGSPTGFLLCKIQIVQEDATIHTPKNNATNIGETTCLAKIQALLISLLGEMIAYEGEGNGTLFQDIVPVQGMADYQSSTGSNSELEIHTEQAFSMLRPDFLSLACLRGDANAFTYILPLQCILDELSSDEIALLQQPLWYTGVDLSFKLGGNEFINGDLRGPMPILDVAGACPRLIFDQDLMRGTDDASNKILKKIVAIYYRRRISHNLQPGEILFIDNRTSLHGRSSFSPKYDGFDRFLIRCFATLDYETSEYARKDGGRIVSAIYS